MVAATLAAAGAAAGAAHAAALDSNAYEVCAVYGAAVDPRFCADYIDPAALWVDPLVTGGTEEQVVLPGLVLEVPPNPPGHADGLRVEGLRP
jgi:hypothetical protein